MSVVVQFKPRAALATKLRRSLELVDEGVPLDLIGGWYIVEFYGDSSLTMGGPYATADDARSLALQTYKVGINVAKSRTEYRSADGRWAVRK